MINKEGCLIWSLFLLLLGGMLLFGQILETYYPPDPPKNNIITVYENGKKVQEIYTKGRVYSYKNDNLLHYIDKETGKQLTFFGTAIIKEEE